MATITNTIRWATNAQELAAQMKLGLDSVVATHAAVDKLVQSFEGDKIIQAANKWTAAIQQVGGVTKLTATEQERANAIFDKAIEKMTLLGKPIPSLLIQYSDLIQKNLEASKAAETASTSHGKLGEALRLNIPLVAGLSAKFYENAAALGAMGVAVGGLAVAFEVAKKGLELVNEAAEDAKQLRNLSTETQIGTEALQVLSLATKDYGVDSSELARGIFQLSKRIAGQDDSAAAAIGTMGLSIRDLKGLAPDQMFLTIMRAVNGIPDPTIRSSIAAELFGTRFAQALLKIGPGLDELVNKIKGSNSVISDETTKALADYAIATDHLNDRWKALEAEGLKPFVTGLVQLIDLLKQASDLTLHFPTFRGQSGPQNITSPDFSGIPKPDFSGFGLGINIVDPAATATSTKMMADSLSALRQQIVPLTAEQNKFLASLSAIGPEFITTQRLLGSGITPDQVAAWKAGLQVQQELVKARAQAAQMNAQADAMETGDLQSSVSARMAALDAEHQAAVSGIKLEVQSTQKTNAQLESENITYQAKRRLITASGTQEVANVERASAEEIAKIQSKDRATSLADQLSAIDMEVYQKQQGELKKIGYTADEWRAEQAIYEVGEAQKQKLINDYNKKEADAERKLQAEITGLQDDAYAVGLDHTIANINKKQALEEADLEKEQLDTVDWLIRLNMIQQKYDLERGKARTDNERATDKTILQLQQETQDATVALTMTGMQAELAILDNKRDRKLAQLHLEKADNDEVIAAENAAYEAQKNVIIAKYDPIHKAWLALNTDMRQTWADTWSAALQGTGNFADALLSPFHQIEKQWLNLIGAMVADWENQLIAKITGVNIAPSFGSSGGTGAAGMLGGSARLFGSAAGGAAVAAGAVYPSDFVGPLPAGATTAEEGFVGPYAQQAGGAASEAGGSSAGSMVGGAVIAGQGIYGLLQAQGVGQNMLAGTEAGAGIGTMIMPGIGTAIGAGAGALVGLLKGLLSGHEAKDIARSAGQDFGQSWSDSLQKTIKTNVDAVHDEMAGELISLPDIIKEHPIDASNVEMYAAHVRDLFVAFGSGKLTLAQTSSTLESVFPALATAATDSYGRISDSLKEVIKLNAQYGTDSKAIAAWQETQGANVLSGFADIEAAQKDSLTYYDKIKAAADTGTPEAKAAQKQAATNAAPELSDLGLQAVGSFETAVGSGMSKSDALKAQSGALTDLEQEYKDLGIDVTDVALKQLFMSNNMMKSAPTLIAGIDGLSREMVGLDNLGQETVETFAEQERTGERMFQRLSDAAIGLGGTAADALPAMQDYLHNVVIESEKLHQPIDDATQSMIDQSKQAGIWKDDITPAPTLLGTLDDLNTTIEKLDRTLRGLPPLTKVKVEVDTSHTDVPVPGAESTTEQPAQGTAKKAQSSSAASSGVIVPSYAAAGSFGRVIDFRPIGTDTEPYMLTPNEEVVSVSDRISIAQKVTQLADYVKRQDRSTVQSTAAASAGADQQPVENHLHVNLVDGRELAEVVWTATETGGKTFGRAKRLIRQMAK